MNHITSFPQIPNSLLTTLEWLIVSKAFDKSMKIAPVREPLSASFPIKSVQSATASSVEHFEQKPNWCLQSKLFLSKCSISCLCTTHCKIFDMTGNSEMGLYLSLSVLLPFLNNGMTLAVFHADGTDPVCNDRLIKKVKGAAKMEAASFIIPCGKSSNPTAFFHFRF